MEAFLGEAFLQGGLFGVIPIGGRGVQKRSHSITILLIFNNHVVSFNYETS